MFSNISPIVFLSLSATVLAALDGPCNYQGQAGTCIDSGDCAASGGSSVTGFCPDDPVNIKCCLKDDTSPADPEPVSTGPCNFQGQTGTCIDVGDCATAGGSHVQGYCPNDPDNIRCCLNSGLEPPAAPGPRYVFSQPPCYWRRRTNEKTSGNSDINIAAGGCKAVTLDSGYKILDVWGDIVYEVGCYRDDTGDHGRGAALDFMVAPYGVSSICSFNASLRMRH